MVWNVLAWMLGVGFVAFIGLLVISGTAKALEARSVAARFAGLLGVALFVGLLATGRM